LSINYISRLHSAFTDKLERNCHFPASGRNCTTHCQALQDFPDTSQVSLHKNNKFNLPILQEVLKIMSLYETLLFCYTAETLLQMDEDGVPDMDTMVSMLPESMQERGGKMISVCKSVSE
jgi:hypothetical protein